MILQVYTITWNEENIIEDFISWYRSRVPNCKITIWDNESTDNTVRIAKQHGCEVISFNTNNFMDEQTLINIRNTCWKNTEAVYCCVVDADEWVAVNLNMLQNNIQAQEWDVCKCEGYEMFGTGESMNSLLRGVWSAGYCKPSLFKRSSVTEMNFDPGNHSASPQPIVKIRNNYPNLYHTKWRSWENGIERAHLLAKRRSGHSKKMGWNIHYSFDEEIHREYYTNGVKNSILVR